MKLLTSPTSPYGRKVRIALLEKKLTCEIANEPAAPHNPLAKIPTLVLDDGTPLFDSVVIIEYIEALAPVPRLIPDDIRERALVRRWEAVSDGIAEATVLAMLEGRRAPELQDKSIIERQLGKVRASLDFVESTLGAEFAHGASFSLADAALVAALGYLDYRFPDVLPSANTPSLHAYYARIKQRASVVQTAIPA